MFDMEVFYVMMLISSETTLYGGTGVKSYFKTLNLERNVLGKNCLAPRRNFSGINFEFRPISTAFLGCEPLGPANS